jgi:putative endopeptidase
LLAHDLATDLASLGAPPSSGDPGSILPAHVVSAINANGELISVPGGILGGFFSPKASDLANLAGIGAVFGHEIGHSFGPGTQRVDSQGVRRNWMTPATEARFSERLSCMSDQYDQFAIEGVPDPETGAIPAHVLGRRILRENVPDNVGIKAAFRASKAATMTGPMASGLSPAAQFFVGYAQLWCRKIPPALASEQLTFDGHAPPAARVNVPLTNFEGFADTFKCRPGSPMAPANRCTAW